ncbi:DUF317 domain-containing protein [Streptomyces griseofuscus]|uniref:DUF317 domain-containing protein n=1 Tax=Streptomyces griseofuscus TaxID=146922 RepID=UPI00381EEAD3
MRWTTLSGDAGIQFDAFAAQKPNSTLATWTIWAGPSIDHRTWTIHASTYTPASLLADLAEALAHGTGTHQRVPGRATLPSHRISTARGLETRGAQPPAGQRR